MVETVRLMPEYRPMPILFNEDDHFDFEKDKNNMMSAINAYASWGFLECGDNNYRDGYQSPPVNWGINTPLKKYLFEKGEKSPVAKDNDCWLKQEMPGSENSSNRDR